MEMTKRILEARQEYNDSVDELEEYGKKIDELPEETADEERSFHDDAFAELKLAVQRKKPSSRSMPIRGAATRPPAMPVEAEAMVMTRNRRTTSEGLAIGKKKRGAQRRIKKAPTATPTRFAPLSRAAVPSGVPVRISASI